MDTSVQIIVGDKPERDMEKTEFAVILEVLDKQCEGFELAVFYDKEGEAIDYHSYLNPYDTKLYAAHLGVIASFAGRQLKKLNQGKLDYLEICAFKKDSITIFMGDGLYVSVVFKAGFLNSKAINLVKETIKSLKQEAYL